MTLIFMMADNYFICGKVLEDKTKVAELKSKGTTSFRIASKKRKCRKGNFLVEKRNKLFMKKSRKQYIATQPKNSLTQLDFRRL